MAHRTRLFLVLGLAVLPLLLTSVVATVAQAAGQQNSATAPSLIRGWSTTSVTVAPGHSFTFSLRVVTRGKYLKRAVKVQYRRPTSATWTSARPRLTSSTGYLRLSWTAPRAQGSYLVRAQAPRSSVGATILTRARTVTVRDPYAAQLDRMLRLVNTARSQSRRCGATTYPARPKLRRNASLDMSARRFAGLMASRNFFSHISPNGDTFIDRIHQAGYHGSRLGENIAAGQRTAAQTMTDWLASPSHCRNIMGNYQYIGLGHGYSAGSAWKHYWVQDFGGS